MINNIGIENVENVILKIKYILNVKTVDSVKFVKKNYAIHLYYFYLTF